MQKFLLIALFLSAAISTVIAQSTAVNFTANDCAGTSHDLFTELEEGKVIVMAWVMPCTACIGPALTAYNIAESYATANPGKVAYYLIDDFANTNCTTLTNWGSSNNIGPDLSAFSNAEISMLDYGSPGMPKVVITGGSDHTVYFNENNGDAGDVDALEDAMQAALAAVTGIGDDHAGNVDLNLSVNSSLSVATLNYTLANAGDVSIDIFNALGQKLKSFPPAYQSSGNHQTNLNLENIGKGVYFLKFKYQEHVQVVKFTVSK